MKELDSILGHPASKKTANVLRFTANWCGPCRQIAPAYKKMALDAQHHNVGFLSVDIDRAFDVAAKYGVKSVPTFVILGPQKDELSRIPGGNLPQLEQALRQHGR